LFIHANLIPILELVERERENIYKKYTKINQMPMPGSFASDPFSMFGFYCGAISENLDLEIEK
jgi:hypothetical protein